MEIRSISEVAGLDEGFSRVSNLVFISDNKRNKWSLIIYFEFPIVNLRDPFGSRVLHVMVMHVAFRM